MTWREAIAYGLIAIIAVSITTWAYRDRRRKKTELRRRHGPRPD